MKTYLNSFSKEKELLLLGDILLVLLAFFLSAIIKTFIFQSFTFELFLTKVNWLIVLCVLLYPMVFYVFDLYNPERWKYNIRLIVYIATAVSVTSSIVALLSYLLIPDIIIGRTILFLHINLNIIFIFFWRKIFENIFSRKGSEQDKILVIGNSPIVNDIKSIIREGNDINRDSLVFIKEYTENPGTVYINGSRTGKRLYDMVSENKFKTIVISERLSDFPLLKKQLLDLKFGGVAIYDAPYFYEALTGKVAVNHIKDSWFLFHNQGEVFNPYFYRKIKKILDRLFALIGIILSSPLMFIAAIAIILTSRGPVFFKQERLGQNEQPFTIIKFRTMINDAEKTTGPKWASLDDTRITKVGKLLRKTRIDELPQLFNVLKGDMSFVGPRPIRKHFADILAKNTPFYRLRFVVKPGLTGWAQVKGNYADSVEDQKEKLEYDLYYIQNQSILFDLFIILKTIQTVLFHRGQ